MTDKICCSSGRSLYTGVRHHIQHAFIALMTYSGDDGKREIGHVFCQCQGIETAQIAGGAAATYNHYDIEIVDTFVDGIQCSNDTLLYLLALHHCLKELDVEMQAVFVAFKLVAKVAIARCIGTRHHCYALCKHAEHEFFLQFEYTLALQYGYYFLPFPCHIAHRIGRIDVGNNPCKAVSSMEIGMYFQHYFQSGVHSLSGNAFEMRTYLHPFGLPALGCSLGDRRIRERFFLYQLHIAVSPDLVDLCQFRLYPILIGHRSGYGIAYKLIKFV